MSCHLNPVPQSPLLLSPVPQLPIPVLWPAPWSASFFLVVVLQPAPRTASAA